MKQIFILFLLTASWFDGSARSVIDMFGRTVDLPDKIERVLPYDSKTSVLLFSVDWEKVVARAMLPGKERYSFLSPDYKAKKEVDVKSLEEVLSVDPQVIIAGYFQKPDNLERFEKMQKRLHIPVVLIDLSIDHLDKTYLFLNELFKKEDACKQQMAYLKSLYAHVDSLMNSNPSLNATAYYCIGESGLLTDPEGSKHTEVFNYLKIHNAAKIAIPSGGHAKVNMEQIIMWNPNYIFAAGFKGEQNAYHKIMGDSKWASINALKNEQVYKVPSQPFGWFDHPPSINRIPGVIWLCSIFYGQSESYTHERIVEFYEIFYRYRLSEEDYKQLFL